MGARMDDGCMRFRCRLSMPRETTAFPKIVGNAFPLSSSNYCYRQP